MEVKSVKQSWCEKCNASGYESSYVEELLSVDKELVKCDNILSEVYLQTGYSGYEKRIYEIVEKREHLWSFVLNLPEYMRIHLDEPLQQKLNHGACEAISRIHIADFQVENTLGVQVQMDTRGYADITFSKDKLSLMDFLGNAIGENAKTCVPNLSGRTCECVEEFAVIFQQQYDDMVAQGKPGEYPLNLESYLDQIVSLGEYGHKEDHPLHEVLWSNFLDLFIIKPLIESCCGYNLVTGEDLTEMERSMNVVGAIVDTVTLVTGIYGFTTAAKEMGWKKAAAFFGKLAMVELAADASATVVASLGEYYEWPAGVTLLLSLGTGLTVGQVGNHLIFKQNGIEIFRKEVIEGGSGNKEIEATTDVVNNLKQINIHGNINSELDEVDLVNKIIYEDKSASLLYLDNPDFPQTEAQWAYKHIYKKGSNRIIALQQTDFTLSGSGSLPDVELLKGIKEYVFRIDADTPELRAAVQKELDNLKEAFPDYNFSAIFGGKK